MIAIRGFRITEQIHESTRTRVYKGIRLADNARIIAKTTADEYPSSAEIARITLEYTITKDLDLEGVIKAYELREEQNRLVLIKEDVGGGTLSEELRRDPGGIEQFLTRGIQMAEVMHQLHFHNVIHRDLKPDNLIVNAQTGKVYVTDFGTASLLPREIQQPINPGSLEGTLAYMSPEQTGRINRAIDHRSDFYSLGVIFFEMLAGRLPFEAVEPIAMVHCHLAVQPPSVREFNAGVPEAIALIIDRLLAKTPEERYQSASGLSHDLQECLKQIRSSGHVRDFQIGSTDLSERFRLPQTLYGRTDEIQDLLDAFARVSQGSCELLLVTGQSGLGKSTLVNEVQRPIIAQRGYFAGGKYDQFKRDIPYSAIIQAFAGLVRQILTEDPIRLKEWRERFIAALGVNGQLIVDVLPELELIAGKWPPVVELPSGQAANRFRDVFRSFLNVCASSEHPLVMFIDDLQWADSGSLQLMQTILADADADHLLWIGAYRDNEVLENHPLSLAIEQIKKMGRNPTMIRIEPLGLSEIKQMLADTLRVAPEHVTDLANLVFEKTAGNPSLRVNFSNHCTRSASSSATRAGAGFGTSIQFMNRRSQKTSWIC